MQDVVFEYDNSSVIDDCKGTIQHREIRGIVADIETMKERFRRCEFTWVFQKGNTVAHTIAKLAMKGALQGNWMSSLPTVLNQALITDAISAFFH